MNDSFKRHSTAGQVSGRRSSAAGNMAGSAVFSLLVCLVLLGCNLGSTNGQPQVITSNGQLKFVSSNNQDIIFQPSGSGRVLLNGAPIQSAGSSGIKGTKGDTGATGPQGNQGTQGVRGPQGVQGPQGPQGPPGPAGTAGSSGGTTGGTTGGSTGTTTCPALLPTCPFWLNINRTKIAATGAPIIEFATQGLGQYYNPSYLPTFTCRLTNTRQTVISADVAITRKGGKDIYNNSASGEFYVVNCVVPAWKFANSRTFTEQVELSLWHLDTTEIPFQGKPAWKTVNVFTTTYAFAPKGNQIAVRADGLDTTAQYICRFDDTNVPGTTYVNSPSATNPSLATQINCPIPVWTTGSAATISTKISLWVYENGSPVAQVPHATSVDDTYTLDRCKDGVKNHGETDVDCGGQCRAGCTLGKSCSVVGDCISGLACNSGKCVDVCNGGYLYKGICLRSSRTSVTNSDNVPSGCLDYQPTLSWTFSDYSAICNRFKATNTQCTGVDYDSDGGRCSNHRAIMAFENPTSSPDVWVASKTFSWNPVTSGSPSCILVSNPPGIIVYACKI